MHGMARTMIAMEKLAEFEKERIKGLEDSLQGIEKAEYERLKEGITIKNKKTWRKARAVGIVGMLTIASSLYLAVEGFRETDKRVEEQKDAQIYQEDTYFENRSSFLDYSWWAIIAGNVICAAGFITGQYIMNKRGAPLETYLENHANINKQ